MPRSNDTRSRLVVGAADALQEYGVAGASFNEVLARTGGPRGSLRHHFPGGKQEMIVDAVRHANDEFVAAMRALLDNGGDAAALVKMICSGFRTALIDSGYAAWCPVGAVAAEFHNDDILRITAATAFARWRDVLTEAFNNVGCDAETGTSYADLIISAVEGAVLLSRVERSTRALDNAERHLTRVAGAPTEPLRQTPAIGEAPP